MSVTNARHKLLLLLLVLLLAPTGFSQISHGGQPLPVNASAYTRALQPMAIPFVEMPSFDLQQALLRSSDEEKRFRSLEFAHKFHVSLRPDNSGITFTTLDNRKVWRVGIRSRNAYSVNILFSKFRLPEGAKVFVYNSDQSEVLGSFTHENNSELNLLPVQPIAGDEIIVEYQEPLDAPFKGEIEIGEVNHDFRGIFRATEPRDPSQSCHPDIVCYPEDIQPGSGVVALIINGTTYCTGSLVNNTTGDGTPYLLTATHCINRDYDPSFLANRRYNMVAGTIVAFFSYQSPVCGHEIRGPLQMTMASADSVLISERYDISLLRFKQVPPKEYQPYYLGWNVSASPQPPFHGLHHPNGGVKKVAVENDPLVIGSFDNPKYNMEPNGHWAVRGWDVAATEEGSSGSPLLDNGKRILGALTGGVSECSSPKGPDLYSSLYKAWNVTGSLGNPNSLKSYLDPVNSQVQQIDGFNPYKNQPYTRSSNYSVTDSVIQTYYNSIPIFATNNTLGYNEFAEEFHASVPTSLDGVFVTSPITNNIQTLNVRIRIYSDNNGAPGSVVYEVPLRYSYRYYQSGSFQETPRDMRYNVENYVKFPDPVEVSGKFYISYSDANQMPNGFSLLNVKPRKIGSGVPSTAWMKNATGWVKSSENIDHPVNTSLLITPYVIGSRLSEPNDPSQEETKIKAYYSRSVERIFIESNKDLVAWEVFYVSGQKVFEEKAESSINRASFPVGHLAKGVYVVKVRVNDKSETLKVLVR